MLRTCITLSSQIEPEKLADEGAQMFWGHCCLGTVDICHFNRTSGCRPFFAALQLSKCIQSMSQCAHNLSLACRKHLTIDVQGLRKDLAKASGDFELLVRCSELPACETWPFTQASSAAGGCAVDTTHDFMVSNQNTAPFTFHSAPTQPPERLGSQSHNSFCSVGHSFF